MGAKKNRALTSRVIALLMAVYLFNFSIDSRDAHSDTIAEDLSINDIESVYEFLTEGLLDIENAVQEHDERDHEDGGSFTFKKIFIKGLEPTIQAKPVGYINILHSPIDFCQPLAIRSIEIISPPPRG